jgi:hypothetical protein
MASTGTMSAFSADTNPDISVVGVDLNWLYIVIEKVITAAIVANITLLLLKKRIIEVLVTMIGTTKIPKKPVGLLF